VYGILSLRRRKGIDLYAVKGEWQLDGTMQSKIMAMVFAMAAEIERELISQWTKEALRVKKAAGAQLGSSSGACQSTPDPYQPELKRWCQRFHTKVHCQALRHNGR